MAQDSNNTAERELLNLIEGKSDLAKPAPALKPAVKPKPPKAGGGGVDILASINVVSAFLSSIAERFRFEKKEGQQSALLSQIKNGLMVITLILFVVFVVTLLNGMHKIQGMPRFVIPPTNATAKGITLPLKDYSYYVDRLLERNIFTPYAPKKAVETGVAPKINEQAKEIRLTGISWADKQAECFAIIEDMQAKITYFLKEGDALSRSNIIVKKIYKDKVILGYQNEELELR